MLDEYRRSFVPAFEVVFEMLEANFSLAPTGRPEKSRRSLTEKLQRESARLSQVQDIAGCRVVVRGIVEQDGAVDEPANLFEQVLVVDRRVRPSHGYRAVHVMVMVLGRTIEVQVRTELQHLWAELSEKLSDRFGIELKYGGGAVSLRDFLLKYANLVAEVEKQERQLLVLSARLRAGRTGSADFIEEERIQQRFANLREAVKQLLRSANEEWDNQS